MTLQFVPLTDELLYAEPALLETAIVPFSLDYEIHHALAEEGGEAAAANAPAPLDAEPQRDGR